MNTNELTAAEIVRLLRNKPAVAEAEQRLARVRALWASLEALGLSRQELEELGRLVRGAIKKLPRESGRPSKSPRIVAAAEGFSHALKTLGIAPRERDKMLRKFLHVSKRTVSRRHRAKTGT